MTLVELLVAMVVMTIGISAIVAAFTSGLITIQRGAKASTAGALADQQMEALRRHSFGDISTATSPMDGVYTAPGGAYDNTWKITATCPGSQNYCLPSRTTAAPGGSYRIDTYVVWTCPLKDQTQGTALGGTVAAPTCSTSGTGGVTLPLTRALKLVTIVVRDASNTSKILFRSSATFDQSTG